MVLHRSSRMHHRMVRVVVGYGWNLTLGLACIDGRPHTDMTVQKTHNYTNTDHTHTHSYDTTDNATDNTQSWH